MAPAPRSTILLWITKKEKVLPIITVRIIVGCISISRMSKCGGKMHPGLKKCTISQLVIKSLVWAFLSGKESTCTHRRCRFNPWIGKIPLEKEMAVFLPEECHGQRSLAGYNPQGRKKVRQD